MTKLTITELEERNFQMEIAMEQVNTLLLAILREADADGSKQIKSSVLRNL